MPRRKKVTVELPVAESDEEERAEWDGISEDYDPGWVDLRGVLDQLGDTAARVHVYRRLKGEKDRYVGAYDADVFDIEEVARDFGGGRYVARIADRNHRFLKGGGVFYIDESRTPVPKVPSTPEGGGVLGGRADIVDKLLTAALARMLEPPPPPPPPPDPVAIVTALATANSKGTETALAMMGPVMDRLARGGNQGTDAEKVVDLLRTGAELFGAGEGKDSWTAMARELGKPLLATLDKYLDTLKSNPQAAKALKDVPADAAVVDAWTIIADWVPKIADAAAHGADPRIVAQMVYDNAPPLASWLEDAVEHRAFAGELLQRFPALKEEPARSFVKELLVEFTEKPEGGDGDHEAEE